MHNILCHSIFWTPSLMKIENRWYRVQYFAAIIFWTPSPMRIENRRWVQYIVAMISWILSPIGMEKRRRVQHLQPFYFELLSNGNRKKEGVQYFKQAALIFWTSSPMGIKNKRGVPYFAAIIFLTPFPIVIKNQRRVQYIAAIYNFESPLKWDLKIGGGVWSIYRYMYMCQNEICIVSHTFWNFIPDNVLKLKRILLHKNYFLITGH